MGIVIRNALLVDLDPVCVEKGDLRIDGDRIATRGAVQAPPTDQIIDVGGAVVLPGLINGHTHLYSTLAVGMPPPPRNPRNFLEILQLIWWRLDRALDERSNETSATIGALDALKCGTTTLIDHHASPNAIDGSLDAVERGIDRVGLRGVLCYEVTDRNGKDGATKGLAENDRYLRNAGAHNIAAGRFGGLVGAHASFTLDDDSMEQVTDLARQSNVGVHIHVAEDPCDEQACLREHKMPLIDRFERFSLLNDRSIFAHGTHLGDEAIDRINAARAKLAHNPRSNMNNAVGYTPIGKITAPIQLGTDGIGSDLFTEAKTAWFKLRDAHAGISPVAVIQMLANSSRAASQALGVTVGRLEAGAAADVIVTDYLPATPLTAENFPGHFIFAMGANHIRHVIANGRLALRDRQVLTCDESKVRSEAVQVAAALWERMGKLPV